MTRYVWQPDPCAEQSDQPTEIAARLLERTRFDFMGAVEAFVELPSMRAARTMWNAAMAYRNAAAEVIAPAAKEAIKEAAAVAVKEEKVTEVLKQKPAKKGGPRPRGSRGVRPKADSR